MNFSPISLLKLQRLARAIKKNLKQPVEMSSKSGMEGLLRIASMESNDQNVIVLYNDFIATLDKQEKAELVVVK